MLGMAAARLGYKCHIFDPHERPLRGRRRGLCDARRVRRRRSAPRASASRSTSRPTSSRICRSSRCDVARRQAPARHALARHRAGPRGGEAIHRAMRRAGRRLARRSPASTEVDGIGRRRSASRSCSRPAATAMTARARPGSARAATSEAAWGAIGEEPAVAEAGVDFVAEFSVIVARWEDGRHSFWDSPENEHGEGILRRSTVPCGDAIALQVAEAREAALRIAEALGHVGVLTVEFFASRDGPGRQRDRAARPQQRPLDDRGRRHLAVRAAHPRDLRPSARLDRARRPRRGRWTI